jgi:hypothetical protein
MKLIKIHKFIFPIPVRRYEHIKNNTPINAWKFIFGTTLINNFIFLDGKSSRILVEETTGNNKYLIVKDLLTKKL